MLFAVAGNLRINRFAMELMQKSILTVQRLQVEILISARQKILTAQL
jgi:hypothetical protein